MNYKFYMQRWVSNKWEEAVSLEDHFEGLKYMRCNGISNKGKVKNIYTESYAEADTLRTYIPETPKRESTDIEFEFAFVGDNRRDIYDTFVDWCTGHKIKYWDTFRNREMEMILTDDIKVSESDDVGKGDLKFIVVKIKFKNLKGQTDKKL